ncbi:MAG: hypothetical protein UV48_C0014G0021 [Candidatus Azambacteria bacterium GW2011_GWA2_42_9]|uniref:Glycoside hydrolase family 57 N-terminal domain-containing protein n=1 Tax=Candidatus Azambacteria bacterium GW2011_GWA2_42_9 TaxID=1618613 RepID=A0A0G1EL86_9BACT|nr:MAG: hypothetical protein UV48_C0014G0021 [Candidatus Azambacteria bacterium GW2011_GWA2_42_9]
MIYITLHLHAYQPPTQDKNIFEKIHDESYEPIINLLEKNPEFSLSLDIAKSLAERWPTEFTGRIARLCRDNRIYLVNTSAYHYLLPLFGEQTILRQMKLNQDFYRENFTQDKQIRGVFPPELAFSPRLAAIAKKAGALWIMADDEPFIYKRLHLPEVQRAPRNWIPITYGCGVVLRSRFWSNRISRGQYENGQSFAHEILIEQEKWQKVCNNTGDGYLILAIDMETFGHHLKNSVESFLLPFLSEIKLTESRYKIVPLDFLFNHFKKIPAAEYMQEGSWSTSQEDLKQKISFPLWLHPKNEFHKLWYNFVCRAGIASEENQDQELTDLLDRAFYSCTPWQYSQGNKEVASWCLPMFEKI